MRNGLSFDERATDVIDALDVVVSKQRFPYPKDVAFLLFFHVLMLFLVLVPHQRIGATEGRT